MTCPLNELLHKLLDGALTANSVAVMDEYIRQSEDQLADERKALAIARGKVKTFKRNYENLQLEAGRLAEYIERLKSMGLQDQVPAIKLQYNFQAALAQKSKALYEKQIVDADERANKCIELQATIKSLRTKR